jgi:amino acid adenylation domain-containing protein
MSLPIEVSSSHQNNLLEQSIASRFQELVEQYPNHLAIKTRHEQITYDRLNRDANLLARAILHQQEQIHQQEQSTEVFALLLDTGSAFIAGMFALLKIGKIYVPLDPTFPLARLVYILQDSQAVMIVTNTQNLSLANDLAQGRLTVLNIDNLDQNTSRDNFDLDISPETPAYILYTSGSTGKPKGVFQSQHNLLHNIRNQIHTYQISPTDRMTLLYSCSVMGALRGILNALLAGATLYPLNIQKHGLEELEKLLVREEITIMHTIPTIFRSFVSCLAEVEQFPNLRLLILGGEMVLKREFVLYQNYCSANTRLFTGIGSTEAGTICCLISDKQTQIDSSTVPAGYPIDDVEVLIVNDAHTEVRRGEVGEIVVKSPYLALGYWQKQDITQEKFVTHANGDRLYYTGDLGRIDQNGCLWTLGRKDLQVKIRGYRIEISEIEMAIFDSGMVKDAVVIVDDDAAESKRLIAYLVLKDDVHSSTREIRQSLLEKLPSYMVPSFFVLLESLPITPNGKINRLALPPLQVESSTHDDFAEPRNVTEEGLVNIWAKLLQIPKVSIHDNFFDLGGHSLLAIQVISRCRQVFSVEVSFQCLFENPTIAALALMITEQKLQAVGLLTSQTITPRNKSTNTPLSLAQQRLWILDQLEPNSALYNIQDAVRLIGDLQVQVLQQALDAIARDHEIIRISYIAENGNPAQVINAAKLIELTTIDLQIYAEIEREIQTEKILQQESQRPFNLASDTMLRGCLIQLAPQQHILLLVIHHIAADAWSMGILWKELTERYQDFLAGQSNPYQALPIQYADFAVWQREWMSTEIMQKQISYWTKQLANLDPVLELPTDFPRPIVQTYRGSSKLISFPENLSLSLQELCRREGVTLYMLLLAAFQTLLYRYTGQEDIVIGSPIAGRNRSEVEGLIGFFINTVVLRTDLSGDPSFQQLLTKVRSTTIEAYSYQDLPFDKLVEELHPERSLSYNPIFQVMFSVEKAPISQREFAGLTATLLSIENRTSKFDVDVTVIDKSASELNVLWNYNVGLFNSATIERMAGHFQTLLEGIVAKPEQVISQLPLLTKSEQEQLLSGWNHSQTEYTQTWVHHLFEEQVERTPEAVAVLFEQQQLTYRELNVRANQLAHYLRSQGVAADQLVGISVERSLEMIVAILGVLKAGAAYIPLDPAYPSDRLAYMIADANISVLLTQNKLRSQFPDHQAEIICLDSDWGEIGIYSQENLTKINTGENLAYVIYTSGSTGKPKGVMISHQALSSFTQTAISEYQITSCDRLLQFASINFDVAVEEIYPALCKGATLILRTNEMLSDLRTFFQACEDLQLTVLNLPTAYWHELAAELSTKDIPLPASLRIVLIGGEKVLPELVRSWQEYVAKSGKCDRLQLINAYGPTETTVSATLYRVPNTIDINEEVPIGRPLSHLQTYILDPHLQLVPIGVSGELHIGGDSLAIGYLNHLELTNEKFIPNPFSPNSASRLYKTGDLARYRADGNIAYLGRIDNQVKIRGFRIELGEIETILSQHPNVRATVITAKAENSNDKRLVAYVVAEQVQPQIIDLRAFLQERLPNYMIPSAFVFLETIPITPNGKIDHKALPSLDYSQSLDERFVAPRDQVEQQLANIWANLLGRKLIGIHDNFFNLGGHSLLSIRLVAEIEKAFDYQFPLKLLFQISTIAEIAESIREKPSEHISIDDIALGLSIEDYRALLSHSAGKTGLRLGKRGLIINVLPESQVSSTPFIWIGEVKTAQRLKLKQPIYVMPGASLSPSMNSHQDYISVITPLLVDELLTAQPSGSYSLGGWCYNGLVAMEIAQKLQKMGKNVQLVTLIDVSGKSRIYRCLRLLNNYLGTLRFHLFKLSKLSLREKWQYIDDRIKPKNRYSKQLEKPQDFEGNSEFGKEFLDLLSKPVREYKPSAYGGKVLLINGSEQIVHGQKNIKYFNLSWLFPHNGWGKLFQGKVYAVKVPCDHLDLMEEPYSGEVGEIIQRTSNLP